MSTEFELFKGKTLGSLFEDIYNNQTQKKAKISELIIELKKMVRHAGDCLLYTSPSPRDRTRSRMPSSA